MLLVISCSSAFALSNLQNVQLQGDILSWDEFTGAEYYIVRLSGVSSYYPIPSSFLSFDLTNFSTLTVEGNYTITLYAAVYDDNTKKYNAISNSWTYDNYHLVSDKTQLDAPSNFQLNGKLHFLTFLVIHKIHL